MTIIKADNPGFTVREHRTIPGEQPVRVVVDTNDVAYLEVPAGFVKLGVWDDLVTKERPHGELNNNLLGVEDMLTAIDGWQKDGANFHIHLGLEWGLVLDTATALSLRTPGEIREMLPQIGRLYDLLSQLTGELTINPGTTQQRQEFILGQWRNIADAIRELGVMAEALFIVAGRRMCEIYQREIKFSVLPSYEMPLNPHPLHDFLGSIGSMPVPIDVTWALEPHAAEEWALKLTGKL